MRRKERHCGIRNFHEDDGSVSFWSRSLRDCATIQPVISANTTDRFQSCFISPRGHLYRVRNPGEDDGLVSFRSRPLPDCAIIKPVIPANVTDQFQSGLTFLRDRHYRVHKPREENGSVLIRSEALQERLCQACNSSEYDGSLSIRSNFPQRSPPWSP